MWKSRKFFCSRLRHSQTTNSIWSECAPKMFTFQRVILLQYAFRVCFLRIMSTYVGTFQVSNAKNSKFFCSRLRRSQSLNSNFSRDTRWKSAILSGRLCCILAFVCVLRILSTCCGTWGFRCENLQIALAPSKLAKYSMNSILVYIHRKCGRI